MPLPPVVDHQQLPARMAHPRVPQKLRELPCWMNIGVAEYRHLKMRAQACGLYPSDTPAAPWTCRLLIPFDVDHLAVKNTGMAAG